MMNLGFEWGEIQETEKHKRFTNVMATCLIVNCMKPKVKCHTASIGPFYSCDHNSHGPSPTQEVHLEFSKFLEMHKQPEDQES